jgi:CO/xanthine dehydrogenase Mo-binding subunit
MENPHFSDVASVLNVTRVISAIDVGRTVNPLAAAAANTAHHAMEQCIRELSITLDQLIDADLPFRSLNLHDMKTCR